MPGKESSTLAVERMYVDHHRWLDHWLRGKLGNAADAADLAQETFIRVLCAQVQAEIREPRAYLATIASRLVANLYRRRTLERAYLEVLAGLPEDSLPSLEEQALMREALLEMDRMLDGLGAKVKQAFVLAQFEGATYADIAARLGISVRSVASYVARAMAHCVMLQP